MQTISHLQGDTLRASMVFRNKTTQVGVDMNGKTVTVRSRSKNGMKLKGLNVVIVDPAIGLFRITAASADSRAWPVGLAEISLSVMDAGGSVTSIKTFGIDVLQRI